MVWRARIAPRSSRIRRADAPAPSPVSASAVAGLEEIGEAVAGHGAGGLTSGEPTTDARKPSPGARRQISTAQSMPTWSPRASRPSRVQALARPGPRASKPSRVQAVKPPPDVLGPGTVAGEGVRELVDALERDRPRLRGLDEAGPLPVDARVAHRAPGIVVNGRGILQAMRHGNTSGRSTALPVRAWRACRTRPGPATQAKRPASSAARNSARALLRHSCSSLIGSES